MLAFIHAALTALLAPLWWVAAGRQVAATIRTPDAVYFASGSNHPGEIEGLAASGVHVGACIPDLRAGALAELVNAARAGAYVFLDSGAFGEVDRNLDVVNPIDELGWLRRLAIYREVAGKIGPSLYFVCPDRVADQAYTLELLAKYAPYIRALASTGARPLVCHQRGSMSLAEFNAAVTEILEIPFVPALPCCRAATKQHEAAEFAATVKPVELHLLGVGPRSRGFDALYEAVRSSSPSTKVLCDSVIIRALANRSGGPGGGPRMLTVAQDYVRELAVEACYHEGVDGYDYTDLIGDPDAWMTKAAMTRVASELLDDPQDRRTAIADFSTWLEENWEHPLVELAMDNEWQSYYTRTASSRWRKREAVALLFGKPTESCPRAGEAAMLPYVTP